MIAAHDAFAAQIALRHYSPLRSLSSYSLLWALPPYFIWCMQETRSHLGPGFLAWSVGGSLVSARPTRCDHAALGEPGSSALEDAGRER